VHVRFFGQPHDDGRNLRDFFDEVAATEALTRLDVAVAWAKESGLSRVAEQILTIRNRGEARIVLGIDKGGATEQGLRMALKLFDVVEVVHRHGAITFHPKIYLARGDDHALVLVGSNNLTAGGVYSNYEAALVLDLDPADVADAAVLDEIEAYFDELRSDVETCKQLDDEFLESLLTDPRYDIADESQVKADPSSEAQGDVAASAPSAGQPAQAPAGPPLFGKSEVSSRKDPGRVKFDDDGAVVPTTGAAQQTPPAPVAPAPPAAPPPPPAAGTAQPTAPGAPPAPPPAVAAGAPTVLKRWTKELTHSDAQQKKTAATKVTGNLKLTEAGHPINHTTYFRNDFFGPLVWSGQAKPKGVLETATVPVELIVNGVSQGPYDMVVDHADYRISDQSNVPTWLKWKTASAYMKSHNHVGDWVSLERMSDGTYRLQIAPAATGPFLA
jgi:HKD family nuclease